MKSEKESLVEELIAIHNIQENPDFEDEVRKILEKYIVFYKTRPPREDMNNEETFEQS